MKNKAKISVTLKINSTSVMLYRNEYLKATDGRPGMTVQIYQASFSTRESVMPDKFDAVLRQMTDGAPQRYRELCQRIENRVLLPRVAILGALEAQRFKASALAVLDRALTAIQEFSANCPPCDLYAESEVMDRVSKLASALSTLQMSMSPASSMEPTIGCRIEELLKATRVVRDLLSTATPGQDLGLSQGQVSDWKMTYFAFSQARDYAGSHSALAARQNWATNSWADEAVARGFATAEKVRRARTRAQPNTNAANKAA